MGQKVSGDIIMKKGSQKGSQKARRLPRRS